MSKTFATVTAEHGSDEKTKPLALIWTNGKQYEIDRVTDARQASSLKRRWLGIKVILLAAYWGKKYICSVPRAMVCGEMTIKIIAVCCCLLLFTLGQKWPKMSKIREDRIALNPSIDAIICFAGQC